MKVLFVASESVPFIKTGGLADVIGSLPQELAKAKVEARVVLPLYKQVKEKYGHRLEYLDSIGVNLSWRVQHCGVFKLEQDGVIYYFLDNEYYFGRFDSYGYGDDFERFAFFSKAVLDMIPVIEYVPDVIHAHDWHTGLLPLFYKAFYSEVDYYKDIRTVFTIHNLHYQGRYSREGLGDILGLDETYMDSDKLEFHGGINSMKAGIVYADMVTTVSETYSEEIQYEYYGEGLDGTIRANSDKLVGIVNGIDYELYNPETDSQIYKNFNLKKIELKKKNKKALQEELGLDVSEKTPIISLVTRLVEAKGIDLVLHCMEELLTTEDVQIIVLGSGDEVYEEGLRYMENKYKGKMIGYIGFKPDIAHKIYAGSDMYLMPSKFEPCGLSQIIALRYGTIPIVRETGGLKDTVLSFEEDDRVGNGITFKTFNAHDMMFAIKRAVELYADKKNWKKIVKNAMKSDYSWKTSAKKYVKVYKQAMRAD